MAAKKTAAGFEFLVESLKANKGAPYSDLKAKAEAKGLQVYPIMFGRAKAILGLVKSAPRASGKKSAKRAKARGSKRGPGRPKGGGESKSGRIRELLKTGLSAAEIAKKVGSTVGLVYSVKATGGGRKPRGRRRGRPAAARDGSLSNVLAVIQEQSRERDRLVRVIEKIRELIGQVQ